MIKNLITATLIATAPLMTINNITPTWTKQTNEAWETTWYEWPTEDTRDVYINTFQPYELQTATGTYRINGKGWDIHNQKQIQQQGYPGPTYINYWYSLIVLEIYSEGSINGLTFEQAFNYESPTNIAYWTGTISQQDFNNWYNFNENIYDVNHETPNTFWTLGNDEILNNDTITIQGATPIGFGDTVYYGIVINGKETEIRTTGLIIGMNEVEYDIEIIDVGGLLWEILSMPFAFISTAFNLTIFPNTPYAINIANVLFAIIGALVVIFVIKKLTH